MSGTVHVRAPCRLHFGMFGFGRSDRPQFGGVGLMVEPPCVEVDLSPADCFSAQGDHALRAKQFAELAVEHWRLLSLPNCRIDVHSPPDHVGLGVGTQLGLAIAAGLRRYLGLPELPAEVQATSVGRGQRSAVGTHGFQLGGLIVDAGKASDEAVGKLGLRIALPAAWRFVLVRSTGAIGVAGDRESEAFAALPPVPESVSRELWRIVNEQMLPAVGARNHVKFGEGVYHFGRLAGECFSAAQGGPFASAAIAELVAAIRAVGVTGVGQSSWGPTVFALTADEAEAQRLAQCLRDRNLAAECEITIARPNNAGASIT
jgi:beta-ribofuranosylaminobenzene 5'-phosphate synthase